LRDRNDSRMTDLENQVERDLKDLMKDLAISCNEHLTTHLQTDTMCAL
jgi:hypothetical protein